jgi:tetratricopeptide (TPR) repeat protein
MTTADSFAALGAKKSSARAKASARRVWQIPLLLIGLGVFGFGVRAVVRSIKPIPFETHVKDIRSLLASGENVKAINQVNELYDYYPERSQQAQLQWLAGDAYFLSQTKETGFVAANHEQVRELYRKAVALGAQPTPLMNERWGLAALALGDAKMAIEKLEAACGGDPEQLLAHARELVAAYLSIGDIAKAHNAVDRLLASESKSLGIDDRAWGYAKKIEMALATRHTPAGDESLEKALSDARQAVGGMPERDPAGRILVWIGRGELEQGKLADARKHLEAARGKFIIHHLDDGRATVLLGKIAQREGHLDTAAALFEEVITGHAGTPVWAAARLGRAEVLALKGEHGEDMQLDYRFVIETLMAAPSPSIGEGKGPPELVSLDQVRASLIAQYERYGAAKPKEALEFLEMLELLKDKETPTRALAWAITRERRARQLDAETKSTESAAHSKQAIELLAKSAEDYLRHSKLTTMDDAISGESLWKAAQLFDEAGETERSIEIHERFAKERPGDPHVPDSLLAVGRLYQSIGKIDKAIPVYKQNIEKNPRTPAAYTSAVNLARCYMLKGPQEENFREAEAALLSLVQNSRDILPTANEYRISLFTLGELYHRNRKWAEAILRFEEAIERYPDDKGVPRALVMLAQTYRQSANEIDQELKKEGSNEPREPLLKARSERLQRAAALFERAILAVDADPERPESPTERPLSAIEEEYLRTSYMDRANCYFALGEFSTAIKLYDAAATRFGQDATAVQAYIQIVNAYHALKQPAQATAAAERARWVLKRIPEAAFTSGPAPLSRQYYEELLKISRGI